MGEFRGVSVSNAYFDSEFGNKIAEGLLTTIFLLALQITFNKAFFRSRQRSVEMMNRREIFQRVTSWREVNDMLKGYDDHKERLDKPKPKIYWHRLIIPSIIQILLFVAQATILISSGQMLVAHGGETMNDYILIPGRPSKESENFCRDDLEEERHTGSSGKLQTCAFVQSATKKISGQENNIESSVSISLYMQCYSNKMWFEIIPNKKVQSSFGGEETTAYTKVFLELAYSSYDGYSQTLLPFTEGPTEIVENQTKPTLPTQKWDTDAIDYILIKLKTELELPDIEFNKELDENEDETGGLYSIRNAKLKVEFDESSEDPTRDIGTALSKVLLNYLKLERLDNLKLYSFDPRTGFYGSEKGDGPRLYQKNIVPQWIWVVCIAGFGLISIIFSFVYIEDPDFYLYRAFLEANRMDPKLGPLAQPHLSKEDDIFYFGSMKSESGLFSRFRYIQDMITKLAYSKSDETEKEKTSFISKITTSKSDETKGTEKTPFMVKLPFSKSDEEKNKNEKKSKEKKRKKKDEEVVEEVVEEEEYWVPTMCGANLGCFDV